MVGNFYITSCSRELVGRGGHGEGKLKELQLFGGGDEIPGIVALQTDRVTIHDVIGRNGTLTTATMADLAVALHASLLEFTVMALFRFHHALLR